jgi:hypothetical protein
MLKSFKDIPTRVTSTCDLIAQERAQKAVIRYTRRYAAVQQKAKLLNCRAISPCDPTAYAISFVELDLDEGTICASIDCLNPLIFLRLQKGGSRHPEEGCRHEHAGEEKSEKGEGFHHLVLLSSQLPASSDVTTSVAETRCYFTHTKCFDTAKVPAGRVLFCALR